MIARRLLIAGLLALSVGAAPAEPPVVRVRIDTSVGPILVALDSRRAPATTANFLAYVDDGRFDGTTFYRATRRRTAPKTGLIQGGIRLDARRILPTFPLEPTSKTGIRHLDATISMARGAGISASGNFFITIGASAAMDARPGYPGYAAFGRVVGGMATVRRVLALPTAGGRGAMRGQMIVKPVRIVRAVRLNGTPKPTGRPKVWKLFER